MRVPDDLVEAFTEAVPFALRELAGVEAVIGDVSLAKGDEASEVSVGIPLAFADGAGRLTLSLPGRTAWELARRILAGADAELSPELVRDCMGEVANVVAGQAKSLLVGRPSHFDLRTPVVLTPEPVGPPGARAIQFVSDAGRFAVYLSRP